MTASLSRHGNTGKIVARPARDALAVVARGLCEAAPDDAGGPGIFEQKALEWRFRE